MSHTQALHTSSRNNDQSIWLTSGRSLYLPAITYMTQLSASLSWQSLSQRDTFSFTFASHINCQQVSRDTRDSQYHNVTHSRSHLHHISTVSKSLVTVTITTWHILVHICITYQFFHMVIKFWQIHNVNSRLWQKKSFLVIPTEIIHASVYSEYAIFSMTAIYQHFVRKKILHRTFMDWTGNCCFVRKMILHRTFMDWTGNCCFVRKMILHRTFMDWTGNCCYNRITSKYRCPADSGVFRISVRRGQGALGVNGVGCGEGAWPLPRKKSLFVPNWSLRHNFY